MARKPNPTKESLVETQPAETIEAIRADMDASGKLPATLAEAEKNVIALALLLGYEGPLAPDLLEEGARESLARINFEIFSVGARLVLLKEQCAHGEFMNRLERLDIEYRMATKMMQATRKFPKLTTSSTLVSLGKSKIFELAMLDNDEAEAFANGEEVRGITLDDVDCMSVSELRRALRKEKADKEAEVAQAKASVSGELASKDKLIADKTALIAKLVAEKSRREQLTEDEAHTELEYQLSAKTLIAVGALAPVRQVVHNIRSLEQCPQGTYVAMQGALDRVIAEAMAIATDYGIQLNLNAWSDDLDALDNPNQGEVIDAIYPAADV